MRASNLAWNAQDALQGSTNTLQGTPIALSALQGSIQMRKVPHLAPLVRLANMEIPAHQHHCNTATLVRVADSETSTAPRILLPIACLVQRASTKNQWA